MKQDYFIMRDLANQTRLNPDAKIKTISNFIGSFNEYAITFTESLISISFLYFKTRKSKNRTEQMADEV